MNGQPDKNNNQPKITRRAFARDCLLGAAGAALGGSLEQAHAAVTPQSAAVKPAAAPGTEGRALPGSQGSVPGGKIGQVSLSRIILGCNLFGGGHHHTMIWTRDLSREYNTEGKIIETLETAEANGINTIMMHHDPEMLGTLKKHHANGGKIQLFMAPMTKLTEPDAYREEVRALADQGIASAYVFGVHADAAIKEGKPELIARAIELIRVAGLDPGVASHALAVVEACEKLEAGAGPDYYIKTLHHHNYITAPKPGEAGSPGSDTDIGAHDNGWCRNPDQTIAFMKTVEKPWVAFKVMAAGMIQPRDGFRYAFEGGADFILAGIFDFQMEEDARIAREILADLPRRTRPWRG